MNVEQRHRMLGRSLSRQLAWPVLLALLVCYLPGYAQLGPRPPCGREAAPPYPALDASANERSWSRADVGTNWKPPACTGWTAADFTTLVTTVARFHYTSEAAGLLRHIGAISELKGVRYWSTTHKRWQVLIVDAYALAGLQSTQRRADFTADEMAKGKVFYFEQVDNLSGKAVYRLTITEATANRIVFEVENASAMHYSFLTLFRPGDVQSTYFLDRESESVWRFYSIVRTETNANRLIAGNANSAINRAVAFYRFLVGIPTDQAPPAAR